MQLRIDNDFKGVWPHVRRFAVRRLIRSYEAYHPVDIGGSRLSPGQRGCTDRWSVVRELLSSGDYKTALDIGCAEGYFVSRIAAEFGCVALGVDADIRRLRVAHEVALANKTEMAGFLYARIDSALMSRLPAFDLVLFLSVLHHFLYEHGEEYSRDLLRSIRAKTKKLMIFDMGQSDEVRNAWAPLLPDMGSAPHKWIEEFLYSAGFSEVRKVGETDAYRSETRRAIFLARP